MESIVVLYKNLDLSQTWSIHQSVEDAELEANIVRCKEPGTIEVAKFQVKILAQVVRFEPYMGD